MEYKGYVGKVELDADDHIFRGRVIGLRDVVTFAGGSVEELERAFKDSVDDYLEFCADLGQSPERSYSGSLNFRPGPDLHRRAAQASEARNQSLNAWLADAAEAKLENGGGS